MKAEFIEWGDIRRECKYPQEDKERYEMVKQEQLEQL